MGMAWFGGLCAVIGVLGTKAGLERRHLSRTTRRARDWGLLVALAWWPMLCWVLSRFVVQE